MLRNKRKLNKKQYIPPKSVIPEDSFVFQNNLSATAAGPGSLVYKRIGGPGSNGYPGYLFSRVIRPETIKRGSFGT